MSFLRFTGSRDLSDARLLESLASLLEAGLLPASALEQAELARMLDPDARESARGELRSGGSLAAALGHLGLRGTDRARIEAAESSGRAPRALRALAEEKRRAVELRRRVLARSLYPLLVIHLAPVAAHLPWLIAGDTLRALGSILLVLVPIDLAIAACAWLLADASRGGSSAAILARIPGVHAPLRDRALARFLRALGDLHESGVPFDRAIPLAASAAGAPHDGALARAGEAVRTGQSSLCQALAASRVPDDTILSILGPAETAGSLGPGLERAARHAEERLDRVLRAGSFGPGVILYAIAVLLVLWAGYRIVVAPLLAALSELR